MLALQGQLGFRAATPNTRRRFRASRTEKARASARRQGLTKLRGPASSTRRVLVESEVRGTLRRAVMPGLLERARAQRLCCLALHMRFEALHVPTSEVALPPTVHTNV